MTRPLISPSPELFSPVYPYHCLQLLSCPSCQASRRQDPQPFSDGRGAPGDQACPGRQMDAARPELSAGCSHCVFENFTSHLCYCLGGRPPGLLPSSLCPAPPPAFSPRNMPFSALSLAGVRTLCTRMRGLVYVPRFVCMCWLSGSRRESRSGLQVCLPSREQTACVPCLPPSSGEPAARSRSPVNAWLATLARGWGMAEMTSRRSCPAWPQVSLAIC